MIYTLTARNKEFYNVLVSKNNRVLMVSETFKRKAGARSNAKSVIANAADKIVVDHTKSKHNIVKGIIKIK